MKKTIYKHLEGYPPALKLFYQLESAGNIYLIGGVLREYKDYGAIHALRDIDIIVDVHNNTIWEKILKTYALQKNRFGGYKLMCNGLVVDTWRIEETWAFRTRAVECSSSEYLQNLPKTVFLNMDSILYDWKHEIWFDEIYQDAMSSKVLDVVLVDNPQLLLNTVRAFILRKRYNMVFSDTLRKIIRNELDSAGGTSQFTEILFAEQIRRYQKTILSKETLLEELAGL